MIKVVTSPALLEAGNEETEVRCFLAGGITKCPDWQAEVIKEIMRLDEEDRANNDTIAKDYTLVLFNPRRENFPINDPTAARNQIQWEFDALETTDIFSMYFCESESDQPICMYELGRNMSEISALHEEEITRYMCLSVENGYSRKQDVEIQTELALHFCDEIYDMDDITDFINEGDHDELVLTHAFDIYSAFKSVVMFDILGMDED